MLKNDRSAKLDLIHSSVNVGKSNLLLAFFQLAGGLLVAILVFVLLLIATSHLLIQALPDSWDRKLQASLSNLELIPIEPGDPKVQAYLQSILDKVKISPLANIPLRLAYSKDKAVNAFAIPGNWIVVTQGLYDAANSENEIAMVLSHELGHFHHRDHMKAYAQGMIYLLFSVALFQNDDFLNYVRGVLSGITNTYSRGKESQADRFALELMQRAYLGNSAGILDFFRKRSEVEGVLLKKLAFFSTHPSSEKRLRQLSKMIQELNMSDQGVTKLGILHKTEKPVVALPDQILNKE